MGVLSNAATIKLIDYYLGQGGDTVPYADWYFALMTTMPAADGTGGVEVATTGGYVRQLVDPTIEITRTTVTYTNDNDIDWGTAGTDWAPSGTEVIGYAIRDAVTAGVLIEAKLFAAPRIIMTGDSFMIPAGALTGTFGRLPE